MLAIWDIWDMLNTAIIILLPVMLVLIFNKFWEKLLFMIPIIEYTSINIFFKAFYAYRKHAGGAGFNELSLMIGTSIAIILAFILLAVRKQHTLLISGAASVLLILFLLLGKSELLQICTSDLLYKGILIWILPFYIAIPILSFQKERLKKY